ncbi:macrophage colony-stimulating factor 1 receptor 1 isoform X1 [Alosa pseudoharengus]|uniref:macrophage colony-stimulating factor 1 receptor 1 isoform X1 n=1 Tax=Alosa pseudoharengus TaxID=34774 RepID=UPI003F897E10
MILYLVLLLGAVMPCAAQDWRPPDIGLNYTTIKKTEITLPVGTRFTLSCRGDGINNVSLKTSPLSHRRSKNLIKVKVATITYTGRYRCFYDERPELYSEVYIYITNGDMFTPPKFQDAGSKKEGSDYLLDCLLTDPQATDFSLRLVNGSALPHDLNYTMDPKRGILMRGLLPSHSGKYVCSATLHGIRKDSEEYPIKVEAKLRSPPGVRIRVLQPSQEFQSILVVGEKLQIECVCTNPNYDANITWTHTSGEKMRGEGSTRSGKEVWKTSVLTISSVSLSDSGNITCTGANEAGANSSTMHLQVVEEPFIKLIPLLSSKLNSDGVDITLIEGGSIDLGVQITAYPKIERFWWDTPALGNATDQEITFLQIENGNKSVLLLRSVTAEEGGLYTLHARSDQVNASLSFNISVWYKPSALVRWDNGSLTCVATGYPLPLIYWSQCPGAQTTCDTNSSLVGESYFSQASVVKGSESRQDLVESVLHVNHSNVRMNIECIAVNLAGEDRAAMAFSHYVTNPDFVASTIFTPTLIGASSLVGTLIILLAIVFYKYQQKPKFEIRWKIIEVNDGNNYTFIDPTQLPYNEKWEFPRERLRLGQVLGTGAFGKVVEATADGLGADGNIIRVAVKMLKPRAHSEEREALMSELKILSHLGSHSNIVNLLGACTQGGPMLMITEYCGHGDLLNFLRSRAEMFVTSVWSVASISSETTLYKNITEDHRFRSDSGISCSGSDYQEMLSTLKPRHQSLGCHPETDSGLFGIEDLLRFSFDVAQGMDFLASRNCIHRDVAARNVLLTDSCVAKICDFGLARDIMNDSNYVVKGNARLPVKWMSPESIFDCVYTVQSDVWSYGILLWEIFSLGKSPYPDIMVNSRFYKLIQDGYQMSKPDFAPPEMYTIMKMCWSLEPTQRPTFSTIGERIERLHSGQPHQQYRNLEQALEEAECEEQCETTVACEGAPEPDTDQDAEGEPLMKNNYQIC